MKRQELLDALTKLYPTITSSPIAEEMACFRFAGDELRASDGVTWIRTPAPEDLDLECLVPADKFYKLLSSVSAEDVELTLTDDELKVKAGRSKATYKVLLEGGLLDELDFDVDDWYDAPADMLKGLRIAKFAASKDAARGALCGILLDEHDIIAADGARIARVSVEDVLTDEGEPVVMSMALINLLDKYKGIEDWAIKDDAVYFRTKDKTIIGGKAIVGDYPPAKKWLDQSGDAEDSVEFPVGTIDSLDRHLAQQGDVMDLDREVTVTVDKKNLRIQSSDEEESYSLDETIPLAKKASTKIAFSVHPAFLLDILGKTRTMRYSKDEDAGFVVFEEGGFTYMAVVDRDVE